MTRRSSRHLPRLRCEALEDRTTPSDVAITYFFPELNGSFPSSVFDLGPPSPVSAQSVVTGAAAGQLPEVRVFDQAGNQTHRFLAYDPGFTGGVSVALADVTGDGVLDIITGAMAGGGPHVKVFDGRNYGVVREWMAYDIGFAGGVSVASGDVTGDGKAEIVTGAGMGGGPHVRVFDGGGNVVNEFMAYDIGFKGGVSVAAQPSNAGVGNSRLGQIVTGAGAGGGPHVKVFDGSTLAERFSFFAYGIGFKGGVNVAAMGERIVTGAGPGGGPHVKLFSTQPPPGVFWDLAGPARYIQHGEFFAGPITDTSGVRVAVGPSDAVEWKPHSGVDHRFTSPTLTQLGSSAEIRQNVWELPSGDFKYTVRSQPLSVPGGGSLATTLASPPFVPPVPPVPPDAGMTDTPPSATDPSWVATGSGLKVWDVVVGGGPAVSANATVSVFYSGWLADGTPIDSRRSPADPITFGLQQLITGWQEGLLGMKPGGIRRLLIPPELAYGETGIPGSVPPNATLIFEAKLIGVS